MKKIEQSNLYCCELCGVIIIGKCYNDNGKITHIKQCIEYENETKKPLIRITARHPKTLKVLDLYFYSIAQAKKHNPHLIEFEEKEYIKR